MMIYRLATLALTACTLGIAACGGGESSTSASGTAAKAVTHTYPANAGPERNPHKGWNSGWFSAKPESSVGFQYLAWKDFEPTNGTFDYDKVEQILARKGSKGTHFILRLYCEWDGKDAESSCPPWIYTEIGVSRLVGDNSINMTDFNDPKYLEQAEQAIQGLAARYNNDPRVHAIQLGLLGFWGEWHTHGFKQNGVSYSISETSRNRILQAYKTHFTKAPLQGRYPWRTPLLSANFIGYHNDFFIPNDGHSNEFDNALAAGGQWQNGPVGGEVPPRNNLSASQLAAEKTALFGSVGQTMIENGHYSTMAPGDYRQTATDANFADYMRLHRQMGYNFRIEQARFADILTAQTTTLDVKVDVRNVGVAPLYFPLSAEFALLDSQNRVVSTTEGSASANIAKAMPTDTFSLSATLERSVIPAGQYKLVVRLIQPNAQLPKDKPWGLEARNTYIVFANDMPVIEGQWDSHNKLVGGWSVLGTVTLR